jgi:hypothetical protein
MAIMAHLTRWRTAHWDDGVHYDPLEPLAKLDKTVTPAKAGVQKCARNLDSRFRGNDRRILLQEAHWYKYCKKNRPMVRWGKGFWNLGLIHLALYPQHVFIWAILAKNVTESKS